MGERSLFSVSQPHIRIGQHMHLNDWTKEHLDGIGTMALHQSLCVPLEPRLCLCATSQKLQQETATRWVRRAPGSDCCSDLRRACTASISGFICATLAPFFIVYTAMGTRRTLAARVAPTTTPHHGSPLSAFAFSSPVHSSVIGEYGRKYGMASEIATPASVVTCGPTAIGASAAEWPCRC